MPNYYGIKAKDAAEWLDICSQKYDISLIDFENIDRIISPDFDYYDNLFIKIRNLLYSNRNGDYYVFSFIRDYDNKKEISNIFFKYCSLFKENKITTTEEALDFALNKYKHSDLVKQLRQIPEYKNSNLDWFEIYNNYCKKKLGLDNLKLVDSYGGEGKGEDYYFVLHHKPTDEYIKFEGWYTSYDGCGIDKVYIVKPVERLVTFYE